MPQWHLLTPLLQRALREDARSWSAPALRAAFLACLAISLARVHLDPINLGAPGLRLLQFQSVLAGIFVCLIGVFFFADAITEEKEQDSLGLLRLAGAGSLSLLVGKIGGRLVTAMLIIVLQTPFVILSVTLGGVLIPNVLAMILYQLASLWMLAGIAAAASSACTTTARAAGTVASIITLIELAAWFAAPRWGGLVTEVSRLSLLKGMSLVTAGPSQVWLQGAQACDWKLLLGGLGFVVAAVLLGPLEHWQPLGGFTLGRRRRRSWGRAPVNSPIRWQTLHGRTTYWPSVAQVVLLILGAWTAVLVNGAASTVRDYLGFSLAALLLAATWQNVAGAWRTWTSEVHGHTWSTLCAIPRPFHEVMAEKSSAFRRTSLALRVATIVTLLAMLVFEPAHPGTSAGLLMAFWMCVAPQFLLPPAVVLSTARLGWSGLLVGIGGLLLWKFATVVLLTWVFPSPTTRGVCVALSAGLITDLVLTQALRRAMTRELKRQSE